MGWCRAWDGEVGCREGKAGRDGRIGCRWTCGLGSPKFRLWRNSTFAPCCLALKICAKIDSRSVYDRLIQFEAVSPLQ